MTLWKWSQTPSSNATADSTIDWAEGMAPSAVNNSARAMMAAAAKYRDDLSGTKITTGGSADAYTVASNQALTTLTDGFRVAFILGATNTGASTINVDSLGTKPLRTVSGTALKPGELVAGSVYEASYDSGNDEWLIAGGRAAPYNPAGMISAYAGSSAPTGWLLCYGQAISRTTYADLYSAIGTTYGTGDGSTTFNVPDLRGRVPAGKDNMGGSAANRLDSATTLGGAQGAKSVALSTAETAPHQHYFSASSVTDSQGAHSHSLNANFGSGGSANAILTSNSVINHSIEGGSTSTDGTHAHNVSIAGYTDTGAGVAGSAHNNVQPTIILNYIISF